MALQLYTFYLKVKNIVGSTLLFTIFLQLFTLHTKKNLYLGDLVDALRDYPEDRALLNKKSQKARKEVAAKQAATTTVVSKMSKNIIIRLNKEPAIVTALLKLMPKSSKVRETFNIFRKK